MSYFKEPFFVEPKHHFIFAFQNLHEDLFHTKKLLGKGGMATLPVVTSLKYFSFCVHFYWVFFNNQNFTHPSFIISTSLIFPGCSIDPCMYIHKSISIDLTIYTNYYIYNKESKHSEILLNKYNKCLFSYAFTYIYI